MTDIRNTIQRAITLAIAAAVLFLSLRALKRDFILLDLDVLFIPWNYIYNYRNSYYLPLITFGLICLIILLAIAKAAVQRALEAISHSQKISVEEYERYKAKHTREAVRDLTSSESYRRYLQDKYEGKYREIILSEGDQIDLSDDSTLFTR